MKTLSDLLLAPDRRDAVTSRIAAGLHAHVARIPGLRGGVLRAGLRTALAARPDALTLGISRLLPLCVEAMEPLYARACAQGQEFTAFLETHTDEAVDTLMAVIDARAERSRHAALRALHRRLRGSIEAEMREVLPDFARSLSTG